jgi:hypothetical protein
LRVLFAPSSVEELEAQSVDPQPLVCEGKATSSACQPTCSGRISPSGQGLPSPAGTGVFLGGRFSQEDIVAYGGISADAQGVR